MLKNKNIRIICGKNTITPPTPPIIPSWRKEPNISFPTAPAKYSPNHANHSSIKSQNGVAIVNVKWNNKNITKINMNGAKNLLVTIRSILSVVVSFSTSGLLTASAINPLIYAYLAFATTSSAPASYKS